MFMRFTYQFYFVFQIPNNADMRSISAMSCDRDYFSINFDLVFINDSRSAGTSSALEMEIYTSEPSELLKNITIFLNSTCFLFVRVSYDIKSIKLRKYISFSMSKRINSQPTHEYYRNPLLNVTFQKMYICHRFQSCVKRNRMFNANY